MQIIANFSYAGTSKYISHAVENDRTICGMDTNELFARSSQEWEYVEEEEYLNIVHKHSVHDVGCVKCVRLLTKRAPDGAKAARKNRSISGKRPARSPRR